MTRHEETRDVTWLGPRVLLGTGGLVRGAVTLVSDPPADHHEVWRIVSSISLVADNISWWSAGELAHLCPAADGYPRCVARPRPRSPGGGCR